MAEGALLSFLTCCTPSSVGCECQLERNLRLRGCGDGKSCDWLSDACVGNGESRDMAGAAAPNVCRPRPAVYSNPGDESLASHSSACSGNRPGWHGGRLLTRPQCMAGRNVAGRDPAVLRHATAQIRIWRGKRNCHVVIWIWSHPNRPHRDS